MPLFRWKYQLKSCYSVFDLHFYLFSVIKIIVKTPQPIIVIIHKPGTYILEIKSHIFQK